MPKMTNDEMKSFAQMVKDGAGTFYFVLRVDGDGATIQASRNKSRMPGAILGAVSRMGDTFLLDSTKLKDSHITAINKAAKAAGGAKFDFVRAPEDYGAANAAPDGEYEDAGAALDGGENDNNATADNSTSPVEQLKAVLSGRVADLRKKVKAGDKYSKALDQVEAALKGPKPNIAALRDAIKKIEMSLRAVAMDAQLAAEPEVPDAEQAAIARAEKLPQIKAALLAKWTADVAPHFDALVPQIAAYRGKPPAQIAAIQAQFHATLDQDPPDVSKAKQLLAFFQNAKLQFAQTGT